MLWKSNARIMSILGGVLKNYKKQFGRYPDVLAGDKGVQSNLKEMVKHEKKVKVLAIPKKPSDWGSN